MEQRQPYFYIQNKSLNKIIFYNKIIKISYHLDCRLLLVVIDQQLDIICLSHYRIPNSDFDISGKISNSSNFSKRSLACNWKSSRGRIEFALAVDMYICMYVYADIVVDDDDWWWLWSCYAEELKSENNENNPKIL